MRYRLNYALIITMLSSILIMISVFLPWNTILFATVFGYNYLIGAFAYYLSASLIVIPLGVSVVSFIQSILHLTNKLDILWLPYLVYGCIDLGIVLCFNRIIDSCDRIGVIIAAIGGLLFCVASFMLLTTNLTTRHQAMV